MHNDKSWKLLKRFDRRALVCAADFGCEQHYVKVYDIGNYRAIFGDVAFGSGQIVGISLKAFSNITNCFQHKPFYPLKRQNERSPKKPI